MTTKLYVLERQHLDGFWQMMDTSRYEQPMMVNAKMRQQFDPDCVYRIQEYEVIKTTFLKKDI